MERNFTFITLLSPLLQGQGNLTINKLASWMEQPNYPCMFAQKPNVLLATIIFMQFLVST